MKRSQPGRYVAVLGSCCTGDALRPEGFAGVAGAKLRLLLYQGRTSLLGMTSGPLAADEFEYTEVGKAASATEWGFRMIGDELAKLHRPKLTEAMQLADALVLDSVSSFLFPTLFEPLGSRYFLKSWEWERYVRTRIDLRELRLWDIPIAASLAALREILTQLYEQKPDLTVVFHIPSPSFHEGVDFEDERIRCNVDFYQFYCDRLFNEAARCYPKIFAVCPEGRADPCHPNGRNPFHFQAEYSSALRCGIEAVLGLESAS